jgi:excisionase family DNA binding protein
LPLPEAAERLGVSVYTVRRWIKDGKLKAFRPGKEYRIREADLEEFLAAREVRPNAMFSRWLEERFGHSYLALSEEEIEELFDVLSDREDEEERKRELFSAITAEYLATAKTLNLPKEERMLVRGYHREATGKWDVAATASGQWSRVSEEFERSVEEAREASAKSETA